MKKGTGARALRGLIERLMLDVMYDVPRARHPAHQNHSPRRAGESQPIVRRKQDQAAA